MFFGFFVFIHFSPFVVRTLCGMDDMSSGFITVFFGVARNTADCKQDKFANYVPIRKS